MENRHRVWLWTGSAFAETDSIPVSDRGFRYGMSVFESFPLHAGIPRFLDQHLHRLKQSCEITGFPYPADAILQCADVLHGAPNGFTRIYLTAGDGTVTSPIDTCRVLLIIEPREPIPSRVYHRGYDLAFHPLPHSPVFGGLKTGNYWPNLHAFRNGIAAEYNEALLFNHDGHLISACMANVFLLVGGRLMTPALSTGARNGVIREWVMRRATVEESALTRAQVETADEIFLTSSWLGIMPAASLSGRPLQRKYAPALVDAYRKG